ncbi:unnamed protein product [Owenia fusiformis]|uniref:Uncharacterized protein n=1 Tax=Owenia fusiformis TaxID=6347 RepID=A0A8S4NP25_OWEFU|nr:unnamed protein product [Owenia fusiformis]
MMMRVKLFLILFNTLQCMTLVTGYRTRFGMKQYVEYQIGSVDSKLILTAPHGGSLSPTTMPNRTHGCFDNETEQCIYRHNCGTPTRSKCKVLMATDTNTRNLAILIADQIEAKTGKRPHVILNNLGRWKMDANRDADQAAFGVPETKRAYDEFHEFVNNAKLAISPSSGLLLDIHGVQSHPEAWVELGYRLTKSNLNKNTVLAEYSSIKNLAATSSYTFEQILRGDKSLGHFMLRENLSFNSRVVPSPDTPSPGSGGYYRGGYITKHHGSRYAGTIDAIQIESPRPLRDLLYNGDKAYAIDLANAVIGFLGVHY